MRVHIFQQVAFEGPAQILEWAQFRGHSVTETHFFDPTATLPELDSVDLLVVLGGPMSVHDEAQFPWLKTEFAFVEEMLKAGKRVVGICLGAQLIAKALGAEISRNPEKEIGCFPIEWKEEAKVLGEFPSPMSVLHWHGETFAIPEGAGHLATSEACRNQGFLWGKTALGLQFHLEMDQAAAERIADHCAEELAAGGAWVQTRDEVLEGIDGLTAARSTLFSILDSFTAKAN